MIRTILVLLLTVGWPAFAQVPMTGAGKPSPGGVCSQATAFLARTSGLDATHTTAYITMICGMVTDGTWAKLDALWIPATQDQTTAKLNLLSSSFSLVEQNSPTWTADRGYTGNQSNMYLDTQFAPSTNGVTYLQNSANLGVCVNSARSGGTGFTDAGAWGPSGGANPAVGFSPNISFATPNNSIVAWINDSFDYATTYGAGGAYQGIWNITRTGASTTALYKNGSSFGTSPNPTSTARTSRSIYLLAYNNDGGGDGGDTDDQIRCAWVGGGVTGTDAANLSSRVNTFLTAVGGQIY